MHSKFVITHQMSVTNEYRKSEIVLEIWHITHAFTIFEIFLPESL